MSKPGKKSRKNTRADKQEEITREIENIGDHLRTLRDKKGLSITDVCETTRISEINIKAMENQDFSALPADTFTRGLLNIYAEFLGEEPSRITPPFMDKRAESRMLGKRVRAKQAGSILTAKRLAEPVQISSISMAGLLLLVIILLFTGFCLYTSWNPFGFLFEEKGNQPGITSSIQPDIPTPPADE